MKKLIITCLVTMLVGLVAPAAEATLIGDCTNTGYTFMGGWMVYQTPPSSKDYFMTSNAPADGDYWGFGWVKFGDLPSELVDEAWLALDYYEDMTIDPSQDNPVTVTVYAVDKDVATIDASNVADFKDKHIIGDAVDSVTFTALGIGCWEITSIVNDWISGNNYGLVVVGWDDTPHPDYYNNLRFAGLPDGGGHGMVPTLADTCVPEPATVALLGIGSLVALLRRKRG